MTEHRNRVLHALTLIALEPRPGRLRDILRHDQAPSGLPGIASGDVDVSDAAVDDLVNRGVDAIWLGGENYPEALALLPKAPPVIFTWGNQALLHMPSVGMCGSRNVSAVGLQAAKACGEFVARHGLAIVSGYAKGVDTETHLAALTSGGNTVIVLAEGIRHLRVKKVFKESTNGLDPSRVLVLSQFPPGQKWTVGAAMTRNLLIAGLGRALVVIEAGESGGTLDAGLQALEAGRPVVALQFEKQETPPGNRVLLEKGAVPVATPGELNRVLDALAEIPMEQPVSAVQLNLL